MIIDLQGRKIPFFTLIKIYLVGYFISNLLPSNVGGDLARVYYTGKLIDNQAYSIVSVFIERFTGLLFLFFLVITAPMMNPSLYLNPYIFIPAIAAILLLIIVYIIWKMRDPLVIPNIIANKILGSIQRICIKSNSARLLKAIDRLERIYQNASRRISKFHKELSFAVKIIQKDRNLLLRISIITVAFYLLTFMNIYFAFRAFGVRYDFFVLSSLVPTILFVSHAPVTLLGNLGFFESVFVFYFLIIGIPIPESLAMGLLLRSKMLLLGSLGYLVYLTYKHDKIMNLVRTQ